MNKKDNYLPIPQNPVTMNNSKVDPEKDIPVLEMDCLGASITGDPKVIIVTRLKN